MPRHKKQTIASPEQSDREKIIAQIRKIPKGDRSEEQAATLKTLMTEEARDRFVRLANKRVANVLKALDNVARMGNRQVWDYTDEEAAKIVEAIASKLASVRGSLKGTAAKSGFDLFAE